MERSPLCDAPSCDGLLFLIVCRHTISVSDVETGLDCDILFKHFDTVKRLVDADDSGGNHLLYVVRNYEDACKCYRLGSYKGRCILIEALSRCWGYKISELEYEAPTVQDYEAELEYEAPIVQDYEAQRALAQGMWRMLDVYVDPSKALGDYKQWFAFEGDYVVAFGQV